jgi:hypothetical protein
MKIRVAESTGRPEPQFVVEAETAEDRVFLKMFLTIRDYYPERKLALHMHGYGSNGHGYNSFNFGWREVDEAKPRTTNPETSGEPRPA